MPGDGSAGSGGRFEPVRARRARSSTGLTAFLVGTAVGRRHGTAGRDAGADDDDPDRITSMVIASGGVPVDLAHDVVAARFDRVADAMRVLALLELTVPAPSPTRSRSRCWAVHVTDNHGDDGRGRQNTPLHRAAAMSAIGHAGQLLASDAAWSVIEAQGSSSTVAVDLGVHRLGALPRPERIWQLGGGRDEFPKLRSTDVARLSLPSSLSPLIGRHEHVVEVTRLLDGERLVTLTGPGGVGKTRLALAGAAVAAPGFERTCWVDLSSITEPPELIGAVLDAAGLWRAMKDPLAALVAEFERERVLLVVDNCEHVLDHVAEMLRELLTRAHGVVVLATSREPLRLPGEVTYPVPPLVSPPAAAVGADDASKCSAVQLFVDGATRARPSFRLDDDTAPLVASLCQHLDGIPLAIELVAAQVRHLPIEHVAGGVDRPRELLNAGLGGETGRHGTIESSIEWSYRRLDPVEQQLLGCVSTFAGPCPLDALTEVFGSLGGSPDDVLGAMNRLCDHSLVVAESGPLAPEYRMLHLVRAYTLDRASDAGELPWMRQAHADRWARWAEQQASEPTPQHMALVDHHYDELLAALRWLLDRPLAALRLLTHLATVSQNIGRTREIVPLAQRLLTTELADRHPSEWLTAASAIALRYDLAGPYGEVLELARRIRRVAELHDDELHIAIADFRLGDSREHCESLLRHAMARDEHWLAGLAATLAAQYDAAADPPRGRRALDDAEQLTEADDLLTALQNRIRGRIARDLGQFDQAVTYAERLARSRSELVIENAVTLMSQTGLLTRDRALVEEAIAIAHRGLPGHPDVTARLTHSLTLLDGTEPSQVDDLLDGERPLGAGTLWLLCREAIDADDSTTALEHADRLRPPGPFTDAVVAAIRAAAGADVDAAHEALRLAASAGYPLIAVDALEQIAVAAHCSGHLLDAARLLGAAEGARKSLRYAWRYHNEQIAVEAARQSTIRSGDDNLVNAFACGSRLPIQEAAEYAGRARGNRRRPRHGWEALTPTERRVVELVADGSTNVQVAERLMVSRSTVKTHLEHIYTKTGIHNRTELTAEAVRRADVQV